MQIKSIGIDLGKTTFHLIALVGRSQVVVRKKFSRSQLLVFTANLPSSLIEIEAGVGSQFLGRQCLLSCWTWLPSWRGSGRTRAKKVTHHHVLPPFPPGWVARYRLVQNARSRSTH
jgi:hypothetical protein